jgi:hypothetical protein
MDKRCHVSLKFTGNVDYSSFEIELDLRDFRGYNQDDHLLNLEPFTENLEQFVAKRKHVPTLKGTYDFHLKVQTVGATRIWIDLQLGYAKTVPGYKTVRYCNCGVFEFDPEYLNSIIQDFKKLKVLK